MENIERFNQQHKIIISQCRHLRESIAKIDGGDDVSDVFGLQKILCDILAAHYLLEDAFICSSKVEDSQELLTDLKEEFLQTSRFYKEYKNRYATIESVKADIDIYLEDTNELIDEVQVRIIREEAELFPILSTALLA